nr:triose-phosphate isomerase [Rhodocyclus gracilis]
MVRRTLIAGNWKMHGSLSSNAQLLAALSSGVDEAVAADVLVCVPFPYLAQAQLALSGSKVVLGAQDISERAQGAFTGDVSGAMLQDFECRYVLVGHSERRCLHGETDVQVAAKAAAALALGIVPVVCVGETLAQREAGQAAQVVATQLAAVLKHVGVAAFSRLVVAYEPVWAIGTGRTASAAQAQEVHSWLRAQVAALDADVAAGLRIVYGGSVKPENAFELFAMPDIDGGLVGGASLVAEDFLTICRAVNH